MNGKKSDVENVMSKYQYFKPTEDIRDGMQTMNTYFKPADGLPIEEVPSNMMRIYYNPSTMEILKCADLFDHGLALRSYMTDYNRLLDEVYFIDWCKKDGF